MTPSEAAILILKFDFRKRDGDISDEQFKKFRDKILETLEKTYGKYEPH